MDDNEIRIRVVNQFPDTIYPLKETIELIQGAAELIDCFVYDCNMLEVKELLEYMSCRDMRMFQADINRLIVNLLYIAELTKQEL